MTYDSDYSKEERHQRHQHERKGSRRDSKVSNSSSRLNVKVSKPGDDDDKGTVLTCKACRKAFFSRWEAPAGFDPENPVVPEEHQTCERCLTDRIFKKNMAILNGNN